MTFAEYLRRQLAWMRSSHSEYAIVLACAGIVLVLADRALIALLTVVAPAAAERLAQLDHDVRILAIGLPAALLLLIGVLLFDWRRNGDRS